MTYVLVLEIGSPLWRFLFFKAFVLSLLTFTVGNHCSSFWCRKIQPISSAVSKYWEGPPTVWLPTVFKDQLVLGSTPFTKLVRWPLHLGMPYLHPSKYSRSNYFKSKTFVMTFFSQNTRAKIWFLFLCFVFLLLPK